MRWFQLGELRRARAQPFQLRARGGDPHPQIHGDRDDRGGVDRGVVQPSLPLLHGVAAHPAAHPRIHVLDRRDRLHERRDAPARLPRGMCHIEPELVFVLGRGRPDCELLPGLPRRRHQPELMKLRRVNGVVDGDAARHGMHLAQERRFLPRQLPAHRRAQPVGQRADQPHGLIGLRRQGHQRWRAGGGGQTAHRGEQRFQRGISVFAPAAERARTGVHPAQRPQLQIHGIHLGARDVGLIVRPRGHALEEHHMTIAKVFFAPAAVLGVKTLQQDTCFLGSLDRWELLLHKACRDRTRQRAGMSRANSSHWRVTSAPALKS